MNQRNRSLTEINSDDNLRDTLEPVELIDWYSQGDSCSLQIGGTSVVIRFIGRKGRRARIAVSATQEDEKGSSSTAVGRGEE